MPRLSFDITAEEHAVLQTRAARAGQSVQDYVRARAVAADDPVFPDPFADLPEDEARHRLDTLLQERIAQDAPPSGRSVDEIAKGARAAFRARAARA